jgi:hypothetical protein
MSPQYQVPPQELERQIEELRAKLEVAQKADLQRQSQFATLLQAASDFVANVRSHNVAGMGELSLAADDSFLALREALEAEAPSDFVPKSNLEAAQKANTQLMSAMRDANAALVDDLRAKAMGILADGLEGVSNNDFFSKADVMPLIEALAWAYDSYDDMKSPPRLADALYDVHCTAAKALAHARKIGLISQ